MTQRNPSGFSSTSPSVNSTMSLKNPLLTKSVKGDTNLLGSNKPNLASSLNLLPLSSSLSQTSRIPLTSSRLLTTDLAEKSRNLRPPDGTNLLTSGKTTMGPNVDLRSDLTSRVSLTNSATNLTSGVLSNKQLLNSKSSKPEASFSAIPINAVNLDGQKSIKISETERSNLFSLKRQRSVEKTDDDSSPKTPTQKKFCPVPVSIQRADLSCSLKQDDIKLDLNFNSKQSINEIPALLMEKSSEELKQLKLQLLQIVCGSLLREPNFKDVENVTRKTILEKIEGIVEKDPEFILKTALYSRRVFNIRSTSNFLLAAASYFKSSRPFLKKYFRASIVLPSDWVDVADCYQHFDDPSLYYGSLPTALRKVMIEKFIDFDEYQLAKYNKNPKNVKKKKQCVSKKKKQEGDELEDLDNLEEENNPLQNVIPDSDCETEEEVQKVTFNLKKLVRFLHLCKPVELVMALIGKKYPMDTIEFARSGLPGIFEENRAGKRMKLKIPETWETQVSMKGNKSSTWEELIEHKKLPYMAMLRNIRNLLKAGISEKHHNMVLKKLSDEGAVRNSKQSSFRFFSAYDILIQLEKELTQSELDEAGSETKVKKNSHKKELKSKKKNVKKPILYTEELIQRYKKSLDEAVKTATMFNTKHIPGRTLIFIDLSQSYETTMPSFKGNKQSVREPRELAYILALQALSTCEHCNVIGYGDKNSTVSVSFDFRETILSAVSKLDELLTSVQFSGPGVLPDLFYLIYENQIFDNIIVFSSATVDDDQILQFMNHYKYFINPNLQVFNVSLSGRLAPPTIHKTLPSYVKLSGFSDQILQFVGESGKSGQLIEVDNVDIRFNLLKQSFKPQTRIINPSQLPEVIETSKPIKIFISSTFKDFQCERDILTQFVFPEIRSRAAILGVDVQEVDLRWGITEEESVIQDNAVERCLQEVEESVIFIGLIGERYGNIPKPASLPQKSLGMEMILKYPGISVTEMEIRLGMEKDRGCSFFFIRDEQFISEISDKRLKNDFYSNDTSSRDAIAKLKHLVMHSGHEVLNYTCSWGGILFNNQPYVVELEEFALRALSCLWQSIKNLFNEKPIDYANVHSEFGFKESEYVVGRDKDLTECQKQLKNSTLLLLKGKSGVGKTAMAAYLGKAVVKNDNNYILIEHYVGLTVGSENHQSLFQNIYNQLCLSFNIQQASHSVKNLLDIIPRLLDKCVENKKNVIFLIDGFDNIENSLQIADLIWIPPSFPKNIKLVLTCSDSSFSLIQHFEHVKNLKASVYDLQGLEISPRKEMVRKILEKNGKKLEESSFNNQLQILVSKRDGCFPKYLSLACNEVKLFGNFDTLTAILRDLPPSKDQLLKSMVQRLEDDFGVNYVGLAFQMISLSSHGLMVKELHYLLCHCLSIGISSNGPVNINNFFKITNDDDFMVCFSSDFYSKIPLAYFQPFEYRLRSILFQSEHSSASSCLLINNPVLKKIITIKYLKAKQLQRKVSFNEGKSNWSIAKLFCMLLASFHLNIVSKNREAQSDNHITWIITKKKAIDITSFQSEFFCQSKSHFQRLLMNLELAESWSLMFKLLRCLKFVYSMVKVGLISFLINTYDRIKEKVVDDENVLESYQNFLIKNYQLLSLDYSKFWQQVLNENSVIRQLASESIMNEQCYTLPPDCQSLLLLSDHPQKDLITKFPFSDSEEVFCLSFSPNSKLLACGTKLGTIVIFNVLNLDVYTTLFGHSGAVNSLLFLRSDCLASASSDSTICLWDVRNSVRLKVISQHRDVVVTQLCLNPNGSDSFASVGLDSKIFFWKSKSGEEISKVSCRSPINSLSYHPHGLKIATAHWDSTIRIFEIENSQQKACLRGHTSSVRHVSFSESGRQIFSSDLEGTAILWQAEINLPVKRFNPHGVHLLNSLVTKNSIWFTGANDSEVKIWSSGLTKPRFTLNSNGATCISMTESINQVLVAVGYSSGQVSQLELSVKNHEFYLKKTSTIKAHTKRITSIKYFCLMGNDPMASFHDEKYIISTSEDGGYKIFLSKTLNCEFSFQGLVSIISSCIIAPIHSKDISTVLQDAVSIGDEFLIIIGCSDCSVKVHAVHGYSGFSSEHELPSGELELCGHTAAVTEVIYSRNDSTILTCGKEGCVFVWSMLNIIENLFDSKKKTMYTDEYQHIHHDWINSASWSDEWSSLITCSNDNLIKISSLQSVFKENNIKACISGDHDAVVNKVMIKNKLIFSGTQDGRLGIWTKSKNRMAELFCLGHKDSSSIIDIDVIQTLSLRKGDSIKDMTDIIKDCTILSLSEKTIDIWHPFSTKEILKINHPSSVNAISISSKVEDHKPQVISTSCLGNISLWAIKYENAFNEIASTVNALCLLEFHNMNIVLIGSNDENIRMFKLDDSDNLKQIDKFSVCNEGQSNCKIEMLEACIISKTEGVVCFSHKSSTLPPSAVFGIIYITVTLNDDVIVKICNSQKLNSFISMMKLYAVQDNIYAFIASNATEETLKAGCLKVYSFPISDVRKPTMRKIQVKNSFSTDNWIVDLSWVKNSLYLAYCDGEFNEICFNLTNKCSNKLAVSDLKTKIILIKDDKMDTKNQIEKPSYRITAYDIIDGLVICASSDCNIRFWENYTLMGEIFIGTNVQSLSAKRLPEIQTGNLECVTVVLGTAQGKLLVLKYICNNL